ncbi:MAG: glycogen/starch synthase [Pirellulales bacterium]
MRVLYLAAECKPFSKAGGVGDVAGELPPALKAAGVDVEIVTPWYGKSNIDDFGLEFNGLKQRVGVVPSELRGVPIHFVKNAAHFENDYTSPKVRRPAVLDPHVYTKDYSTPYVDSERLSVSRRRAAILVLLRSLPGNHRAPQARHRPHQRLGARLFVRPHGAARAQGQAGHLDSQRRLSGQSGHESHSRLDGRVDSVRPAARPAVYRSASRVGEHQSAEARRRASSSGQHGEPDVQTRDDAAGRPRAIF